MLKVEETFSLPIVSWLGVRSVVRGGCAACEQVSPFRVDAVIRCGFDGVESET